MVARTSSSAAPRSPPLRACSDITATSRRASSEPIPSANRSSAASSGIPNRRSSSTASRCDRNGGSASAAACSSARLTERPLRRATAMDSVASASCRSTSSSDRRAERRDQAMGAAAVASPMTMRPGGPASRRPRAAPSPPDPTDTATDRIRDQRGARAPGIAGPGDRRRTIAHRRRAGRSTPGGRIALPTSARARSRHRATRARPATRKAPSTSAATSNGVAPCGAPHSTGSVTRSRSPTCAMRPATRMSGSRPATDAASANASRRASRGRCAAPRPPRPPRDGVAGAPESTRNTRGSTRSSRSASIPRRDADDPVGHKPWAPSRRHAKTSSMETAPRRMPSTAEIRVTALRPSGSRLMCTTRSRALAICSRTCWTGSSTSDISDIVSSREMRSCGELAWAVDIDPSCPVFMAWSMSRASPPRTSPTMIRSGRMRSALRTSERTVTSPTPSTLGGRASSETTCGWVSRSSAASSIVMSRSLAGMNEESTPRSVVFPDPVPPETTMLTRARTQAAEELHHRRRERPQRDEVVRATSGRSANLRMVTTGPQSERGGMIAFTREPSGSRASTYGDDSSTRRPSGATIRSIRWRTCSSPSTTGPPPFRPAPSAPRRRRRPRSP